MLAFLVVILFVAVVILFIFLNRTSSRLSALEWKVLKNIDIRLDALERRTEASEHGTPVSETSEGAVSAGPSESSGAEPSYEELSIEPKSSVSHDRPPAPRYSPEAATTRVPGARSSRTREEWEALIGGRILNRIGATALVIAMIYFMKYAVDQNWIDEPIRVLIGGIAGFGLWVWAFFLHRKDFEVFAQGIVGAGIGILYLSVYATHTFYGLVSFETAFILMAVVTLFTLLQSLYYRSLAVSVIGLLGGYMTPFVLEGGETQTLGLLSYAFFLNAGLLAMVYRKKDWWPIELMTIGGLWVIFLSWYLNLYAADDLGLAVLFVVLYWSSSFLLGFAGSPTGESSRITRKATLFFNAVVAFVVLYDMLDPGYHAWMGALTLLYAAAFFGQALWHMRKGKSQSELMQNVLIAMGFVAVATWIQFEELDTVIAWTIEGVIFSFVGLRYNVRHVRGAAMLMFVLALGKFLITSGTLFYAPLGGFVPVLNERAIALIVLSAGLMAVAIESSDRVSGQERWIVRVSYYASAVLLFLLIALEVNDHYNLQLLSADPSYEPFFMFARPVWMAVFWSLLSLPFIMFGLWKKTAEPLVSGLIVLAIAGAMIFLRGFVFDPPSMFEPILNIRVLSIFVVGAVIVFTGRLVAGAGAYGDWLPTISKLALFSLLLLIFSLITGETRDFFEAKMHMPGEKGTDADYLGNMQQLWLSGVWLVYSVLLIALGIWRSHREVRISAFALFGLTILKIFLYDLSYLDTLYRIFSFIGLGIVLLGVSYAYQRFKHIILGTEDSETDEGDTELQ